MNAQRHAGLRLALPLALVAVAPGGLIKAAEVLGDTASAGEILVDAGAQARREVAARHARLLAQHAPEWVFTGESAANSVEHRRTGQLAFRRNLDQETQQAWLLRGGTWSLKNGPSARLLGGQLAYGRHVAQPPQGGVQMWLAGGFDLIGSDPLLSATFSADGDLHHGWRWFGQGEFERPWLSSATAVVQRARRDLINVALSRAFGSFTAVIDVEVGNYQTGSGVLRGERSAGASLEGGLRVDWSLWSRPSAVVGEGFVEPNARRENPLVAGVTWYAAARPHHHWNAIPELPVVRSSLDLRTGVRWAQPLSQHGATVIEGYTGLDNPRGLGPGDVRGVNAQAVWVPTDRGRLSLGLAYDSVSATGSAGSNTLTISGAVNWQY